ncbi:uncharacterized protein LOC114540402 [Dendronephthya gigantea]|uniref:uncharacterized protein LOC114540402 n=1 Tax=Dendronephthya gigantea TaxID=151771 RepID=UPI00106D9316|nr:uncharacterized protein LOC114540402 [Dendronephthya gigantea]
MASKDTPKKFYKKRSESTANTSRCRLCNSVTDPNHSKRLFRANNKAILRNVESFFGSELIEHVELPRLICRPCERRLDNVVQFKKVIAETQSELQKIVRTKRCLDVSPSVLKPPVKLRSAGDLPRRRSIDFGNVAEQENVIPAVALSTVNNDEILIEAEKELIEVARRSEPSVLRERSFDGLADISWVTKVLEELSTRCPRVHRILCRLFDSTIYKEKKSYAISFVYSIIMFLRCHELSRVQRINSVLLIEGQASGNLVTRLHKYGMCLEPSSKYNILEDIGKHFIDRAAELVKSGRSFVYVLDNIDWEEKAHDMRQNVQNRSVHAVATSIVFNRVSDEGLPDSGPQQRLKDCNVHELVNINPLELEAIRNRYTILVANILFEYFPYFGAFRQYLPKATNCAYKSEMETKSEVLTMPVLMKDEKKYAECVDVLDQLEKWTHDIYEAAGLCSPPPSDVQDATPTIGTHSRPDQPGSHIPPVETDTDPLCGVKVPCFGDQLTRVRFAGARDLRSGCHTAKQRLDHIYPFSIVDWHTKRSFLKTIFKKLRQRESIGKCYVVEALMEFFQMEDRKHDPTANVPHSASVSGDEYGKQYIFQVVDKFLDEFVFNEEKSDDSDSVLDGISDDSASNEVADGVWAYADNLLKCFMLLADFKDAVATGNEKAIKRASKASGGVTEIVEAFEAQMNIHAKSTSHTHKSSTDDEAIVARDLRSLRPFRQEEERKFETFDGISHNPTHLLDKDKFKEWMERHKNNILIHYPVAEEPQ